MSLLRALAILLCCGTAALAAEPHRPTSVHELDPLVGTWVCRGTAFVSPFAPQHPILATLDATWILDGHWIRVEYRETKTAANPKPLSTVTMWGYDPVLNVLMSATADNRGAYSNSVSSGWSGNSVFFGGAVHSGKSVLNFRETFTRGGVNAIIRVFDLEDARKVWHRMDQESCTKR